MKLGDFRKLTENLSDDTDIIICYRINEGSVVNYPMKNVSIENKDSLNYRPEFSEQFIYVDEDDSLQGFYDPDL